jgi:P27 family predicted phage terminase small subunit
MPKTPSPLALVSGQPSTIPPPPRPLKAAGRDLWDNVQSEYNIADAAGVELLLQCCHASDRIQELSDSIAEDGAVIRTKGGVRANAAIRDELHARAFVVRTLEKLGLTLEALKPVNQHQIKHKVRE